MTGKTLWETLRCFWETGNEAVWSLDRDARKNADHAEVQALIGLGFLRSIDPTPQHPGGGYRLDSKALTKGEAQDACLAYGSPSHSGMRGKE